MFIRSLTYRSADGHHFDTVFWQIMELKKEVMKCEQQKKEMADIIEQDSLVELKGCHPHKLPKIFVRPVADGKHLPREVEIHQNGLCYLSRVPKRSVRILNQFVRIAHSEPISVDILFSNIKHLFFEPCDHELLVIVHLHLRSPIMIGKKKAKVSNHCLLLKRANR